MVIWGEAHDAAFQVEEEWRAAAAGDPIDVQRQFEAWQKYSHVIEECRLADTRMATEIRLICQASSVILLLLMSYLLDAKERLDETRSELIWSQGQMPSRSAFKEFRNVQKILEAGYRDLGRFLASARADAQEASPERNAHTLHELARWDANHGELAQAEQTWMLLVDSQIPFVATNAINSLSFLVLMPQGRYDEAETLLRRSVELNGGYQSANSQCNLGICAFQQDYLDTAHEHFVSVLRHAEGPFDEALHYLALVEEARGNEIEATRIRGLLEAALPTSEYAARLRGDAFAGGQCPRPAFPLLAALLESGPATSGSASTLSKSPGTMGLGSLTREDRPPLLEQSESTSQRPTFAGVHDESVITDDDDDDDGEGVDEGYEYASALLWLRMADMIQRGAHGVSAAPEFWGSHPSWRSVRPLTQGESQLLLDAMSAGEDVKILRDQGDVPFETSAPVYVPDMVRFGWTMLSVRTPVTGSYCSVRAGIIDNDGREYMLVEAPIFYRRIHLWISILDELGLRANEPWPSEWSSVDQLRLTVEWLLRKVETSQQDRLTDLDFLADPDTPPSAMSNIANFPGLGSFHSFRIEFARNSEGVVETDDLTGIVWAGWQFPVEGEGLPAPIVFSLGKALLALIDLPLLADVDDVGWLLQWELMGVPAEQADAWFTKLLESDRGPAALAEAVAKVVSQWNEENG